VLRSVRSRFAALALACTATTVLAAVTAQEIGRAAKVHRKGVQALRSGKIEAARKAFESALATVPNFPDSHIGLGQIAMAEDEFERALVHFEQARDGYRELGGALEDLRSRRYASALNEIALLEDSIRHLESENAGGGMLQIEIQKMRNKMEQLRAIEPPDAEAATDPPGEIFFYIGNALYQLNRPAEALEAWEACRERSPQLALVHNNLALIYLQMGRLDAARNSLATAEDLGFPVDPQFKADLERAIREKRAPGSG
jgi:tetratricopeptide (TPR) repeat protein